MGPAFNDDLEQHRHRDRCFRAGELMDLQASYDVRQYDQRR